MTIEAGIYERLKLIQKSPFKKRETSVLIALFSHADYQTGLCWPSIPTICEMSKLSKSSVYRALRILEASGVVERYTPDREQFRRDEDETYNPEDDHSPRFHRQTNRYVLRLDVLERIPRVTNGTVVLFQTKNRVKKGRGKWSPMSANWTIDFYLVTADNWYSGSGELLIPGLRRAIRNKSVGHSFSVHLPPHAGWGQRNLCHPSGRYGQSNDPNGGLTSEWEIEILDLRPATQDEIEQRKPTDTWSQA